MIVATLATNKAHDDLTIFLKTLELWNKDSLPTVYLYTDDSLPPIEYKGRLVKRSVLNKYTGYTREEMDAIPSPCASSLWTEFQMEKLNLLDWALDSEPDAEGVFYCDADISFLGPLPSVPSYAKVAISPHMINLSQQKLYGTYNAGFVWVKTKEAVAAWRAACPTSRHFEQAALECFDAWENVYHFPVQHNYGWWRFFMGDKPYNLIKDEWTLADIENHVGLMVQGIPICSIHTHWTRNDYPPMPHFNAFVRSLLMSKGLTSENAAKFFKIISGSSAYKI